jgi:hypothetical protein
MRITQLIKMPSVQRVWATFLETSANTVCHRYSQDKSLGATSNDDCPFSVTGLYSVRRLSGGNPRPITD